MWDTDSLKFLNTIQAEDKVGYTRILFDACVRGGGRSKATTFMVSDMLNLSCVGLKCDGNHTHKAWGLLQEPGCVFATQAERNYPQVLRRRTAKEVASQLGAEQSSKVDQIARVKRNEQPRRRFGRIVSEYQEIVTFEDAADAELECFRSRLTSKKDMRWRRSR